jgi:hypothetical protein
MTTHKTISSLAIAVIAVLAAAAPSFAQSNSTDFVAANRVVAAPGSGLNLTSDRHLVAPVAKTGAPAVESTHVAESSRGLSVESFMAPVQFSVVKDQPSFAPEYKLYATPTYNSKPQFSSDDDTQSRTGNRITFVPSRGQKLPS